MSIDVGDAVLKITADDSDLKKSIGGIGKTLKGVGIGVAAVGAGITAALGATAIVAADFESAMREVNTMMLLNEDEFSNFSDEVKDLATRLGVDATESAKALYQAISAGVPKENAIQFLEIASKAAIGGATDTVTAIDGLTTVLNAFKIPASEAQRVADVMFTTVKGGKTTMKELSASFFNVAPLAAAAGVSFEEVSAAISTVTKQGVPTSVATTGIRTAIQAMIKPTKEMSMALDELGYASGDALLKEKGFAGALNELVTASGGSNEVLGKMFGSVEGLQAVLALTGENAKTFAADLAAMGDAAGASTDAFNEMEKSTSRQFDKMMNQFKGIGITIGNALLPVLTDLSKSLQPVIESFTAWAAENPELLKTIVVVVAALGVLLTVIGTFLMLAPGILAAGAIMGTGFTIALGPVGLIIAAIAALIAIGILVVQNWDWIAEQCRNIWSGISAFFKQVWDGMVSLFEGYINIYVNGINMIIGLINSIPGIDIGTVGEFKMPSFAGGGIVPGPIGQPVPIIAHGGEEFLGVGNHSKGGIYNSVTINNPVVRSDADITELARRISREQYRMQQSRSSYA